ncbi:MAG: thiamine-phosphate pyrophosphorylase [Nitrospirae bacterium]|nr:MAG: thiamine-phosphate pyrophosphorylase [Nitrospirota bacterium]
MSRSRTTDFRLYLITDTALCGGFESLCRSVEAALDAGARAVQLREKGLPVREYLARAEKMRVLTQRYGARLFVNDRVDVAVAVDADGVHLGKTGIPPFAAKAVSRNLLVGASTHSVAEALCAEDEGADFITLGPIFATPSKAQYGEPIGLSVLRDTITAVSIPVYGIGGIKTQNAQEILETGASGIALISGILAASDARASTLEYLKLTGDDK